LKKPKKKKKLGRDDPSQPVGGKIQTKKESLSMKGHQDFPSPKKYEKRDSNEWTQIKIFPRLAPENQKKLSRNDIRAKFPLKTRFPSEKRRERGVRTGSRSKKQPKNWKKLRKQLLCQTNPSPKAKKGQNRKINL